MARRGRSKKRDSNEGTMEKSNGEGTKTIETVANEMSEKLIEMAKEMIQSGAAGATPTPGSQAKAKEIQATPSGSASKGLWSEEVEKAEGENPNPKATEGMQQRKWVDVLQGNRDTANGWVLHYSPPLQGTNIVTVSPEEKAEGCAVWKNALVGFVLGAKPRFREMVNYANARWRGPNNPTVHLLQEGIFLFDFGSEEGKEKILEQNWTYWGKPLILKQWNPNMDLQKLDVERVPVWVQFPHLPLDCWTPSILGKVASYLGHPLATDKLTARRDRLAFARVLIEMKVNDGLRCQVPVTDGEKSFMQDVYYEWLPVKCSRCKGYGHEKQNCTLPERQEWVPREQTEVEVVEKVNEMEALVVEAKEGVEEEVEVEEIVEAEKKAEGGKPEDPRKKQKGKGVTQTKVNPPPKVNQKPPGKKQVTHQIQASPVTKKMPNVLVDGNKVTVYLPPNG